MAVTKKKPRKRKSIRKFGGKSFKRLHRIPYTKTQANEMSKSIKAYGVNHVRTDRRKSDNKYFVYYRPKKRVQRRSIGMKD